MERYYDAVKKGQTDKFRNDTETIIATDDRVSIFFQPVDLIKYDRGFDENNLPILIEYSLYDGERYSFYLDAPDVDGVYQPDIARISASNLDIQIEELQSTRDKSLATMFHDFGDGRVMRTAPEDEQNIQKRIDKNQTKKWVMVDYSVAVVSPAELQTALDAAIIAGEQIWDDYMVALEAL